MLEVQLEAQAAAHRAAVIVLFCQGPAAKGRASWRQRALRLLCAQSRRWQHRRLS